jgi:hypothetical protein
LPLLKFRSCFVGEHVVPHVAVFKPYGERPQEPALGENFKTPNGIDGPCFPLTATVITTAVNGATFDFNAVGPDCATGSSDSGPRTGNLTFFVSGGTRRFKHATGSVQVIVGDDGSGNQTVSGHGVLLLAE